MHVSIYIEKNILEYALINLLSFLQKRLSLAVPAFMFLGFFSGLLIKDVSLLSRLILPLTFLMVYPMMVTMQFKKIFERGDSKVQLTAQLLNFAVIPFMALFLCRIFFGDSPYLALGILLVSLLPTSGMTISWTGMSRGNMAAAVKMTVFGLLAGSLLTPFYIKGLMGATIAIPLVKIFSQILVIVVLPMIFGLITQISLVKKEGQEKFQKEIKKKFPPFSTLGVLLMVFTAMALKAKSIASDPVGFLALIPPLFILYVVNMMLSTLVAKLFFNRSDGLALVFGTVLRNLSIALAIAMTSFGKEGSQIALIIALGYIIQIQFSAWYVKLSSRIFGKPEDIQAISSDRQMAGNQ
jgi:ACR3 family arsenite transporter